MQSIKPYLIRAIQEWCTDQGFTPYLAVSVDATTRVPREFVKDGEIVLNVGHEATNQLLLGNEEITFQARFGGRTFPVVVPIERVAAIYASENGEGMAFEVTELSSVDASAESVTEPSAAEPSVAESEDASQAASVKASEPKSERESGRPYLTRVK